MISSFPLLPDLLQEGKDRLDKEIIELMERETKREERIKMRLREDGLLGDEDGEKESIERNDSKNEGKIVEDAEHLTIRLGQCTDEENEVEESKRPRRTVLIEASEAERAVEEGEIREDSLHHLDEDNAIMQDMSDNDMNNTDIEEEDTLTFSKQHNLGAQERKNSVDEKEMGKSSEKREQGVDQLKYKESRKEQQNSVEGYQAERRGGKDRHRNRDKARDKSAEKERRKYKQDDGRRATVRNSRERRREPSRDSNDNGSESLRIKKEQVQEERNATRNDGSDEDDDVVVKEEKETHRKVDVWNDRSDNAGKSGMLLGDGEEYDHVQIDSQENNSVAQI